MVNGQIFYHASRNKVMEELPMLTDKSDTIYRIFRHLAADERALIQYEKVGRKDLIRLTDRGKKWNSEKNPSSADNSENFPTELGKKSENNSEKNPTNKYTNIISTTIDNSLSNEREGAPQENAPTPCFEKEKTRPVFITPTFDEIKSLFAQKLSSLPNVAGPEFWAEWETRKFEEYYAQNNWKVGRAKMKDWKRAVSGWISRGMEHRTYLRPCPTAPDYNNFNQRNGYGKEINLGPNKADLEIARTLARIMDGN